MSYGLTSLQNYFAGLRDYLVILYQLKGMCQNTNELLNYMSHDIDLMEEKLSENQVPGYSDYNFDDVKTGGLYNVNIRNSNVLCEAEISKMISEINGLITIVSEEIDKEKRRLNSNHNTPWGGGGGGGAYYTSDTIGNGLPGVFYKP